MFTNSQVESIYNQFNNHVVRTPCIFSPYLSCRTGGNVYLKLESLQKTGSFKERGVLSYLLKNPHLNHVVTASAGNHAQALALHAKNQNIKATIFMPLSTPNTKVSATEHWGAQVYLTGQNYDEASLEARLYAEKMQADYVHAYNDLNVVIGQATVGLELFQQLPTVDIIIVPVGGGGLIAGISQFAANHLEQAPSIIGVRVKDFEHSTKESKTIAEGIAVKKIGQLTEQICQTTKPLMSYVTDQQIEQGIMILFEKQKLVVEGAGAAGVAALLKEEDSHRFDKKNIVLIISGGNIDISLLERLASQELINSNRLIRMSIVIKDTPGSLSKLLETVTNVSGNIIDIRHERLFTSIKWNEVLVDITVEIKDEAHKKVLLDNLNKYGYGVEIYQKENRRG